MNDDRQVAGPGESDSGAQGAARPGDAPRKAGPPWRWLIVMAAVAMVAALVGVGIARCSTPVAPEGDDATGAAGETTSTTPATLAPTWDMTAQPVPNEYGSLDQSTVEDSATAFVERYYAWDTDVQMPEWHLAAVRDYTTDPFFKEMVDEKQAAPEWAELHKDVTVRSVEVVEMREATFIPSQDDAFMNVRYVLIDTHSDGTETRSDERTVALRIRPQEVHTREGTAVKSFNEPRVASMHDGPWKEDEMDWGNGA